MNQNRPIKVIPKADIERERVVEGARRHGIGLISNLVPLLSDADLEAAERDLQMERKKRRELCRSGV